MERDAATAIPVEKGIGRFVRAARRGRREGGLRVFPSASAMKDVGHGWRAALRYALCENPVDDRQYHQLELTQEERG